MKIVDAVLVGLAGLLLVACQTTGTTETKRTFDRTSDGKRILTVSSCMTRHHDQVEVYFDHFQTPWNAIHKTVQLKYVPNSGDKLRRARGDRIRDGEIDILFCPSGFYSAAVPEVRAAVLANRSLKELRNNGAFDILQKAWAVGINSRILAWPFGDSYRFNLYLVNPPKLSSGKGIDLSGLKIRSTALYDPMLNAMGAETIPASISSINAKLKEGDIHGLVFPGGGTYRYGWSQSLRHKIVPGFFRSSAMVAINLDTYKALPPSVQSDIDKAGLKFEQVSSAAYRLNVDRDEQRNARNGLKSFHLKGKEKRAFLSTVYGATWNRIEGYSYNLPIAKLKAKLYQNPTKQKHREIDGSQSVSHIQQ